MRSLTAILLVLCIAVALLGTAVLAYWDHVEQCADWASRYGVALTGCPKP